MNDQPKKNEVDHWLKNGQYQIDRTERLKSEGFYEKKNLPVQLYYMGLAMLQASLGRARCLNNEPAQNTRDEFSKAADYMIKIFRISYDPDEPEFVKEEKNMALDTIDEPCAIDGMNWALMSGSLDKAREMARWWQNPLDGSTKSASTNRYTHALKHAILGDWDIAEEPLAASMLYYADHPPKGHNYKTNYHTLSTTLLGIVTKDEAKFNEGLAMQLKFYETEAESEENYDTPKGYFCDNAVALANLGILRGLKVTVTHMLMPASLLIQTA